MRHARRPLAVENPAALAIVSAGMHDSFRNLFPDEVAHPGQTWTPTTKVDDPRDRHDRIDFVFGGGASITIERVRLSVKIPSSPASSFNLIPPTTARSYDG